MGSSSKKKSKKKSHKSDAKDGSAKDCCAICGRILLFLAGLLAVVFSLLVVASCEFIEFAATNATDPNEVDETNLIEFSFGQFRYQDNNTECRSIDDENIRIDWAIWTGRVSTAVALISAALACLLILVEFLCCRFKFSRCLMITLFSLSILGMALSFLMFASNVCTSENSQGKRYPCKAGTGAWYAVVAIGLYFVTSISSCFAPRPKPMVARLNDDKNDENDPCICCGAKKKDKHDDDDDESKDEEVPEPVPPPAQEQLPPVQEDDVAPVVVAAAVPVATQTLPESNAATQTAPVTQVVTDEDNESQVSSIVYPSGVSAVTMPTTYGDISLFDGDMFFDSGDGANSV